MKINIGHWVDGDAFFGRERELRNLADVLSDSKASVLVPGPRRIGKTSLLMEFIRRHCDDYQFIYFDLESRQSIMVLCRDLIRQLQKSYPHLVSKKGALTGIWNTVAQMLPGLNIGGFVELKTGEITQEVKVFMDRMEDLFEELTQQGFIFVFDEFSDFLWKLKENGINEVRLFLEWLRQLRQQGRIRLILSGSINIISTVEELNLSDLINDLTDLDIFPLRTDEIRDFLAALLSHIGVSLTDEAMTFAVDRLGDGIPFFVQLFAASLRSYRDTDDKLYDIDAIKEVYAKITGKQHKEYIDLHSRLKDYLPEAEFRAALKILAHVSSDSMTFDDLWPYAKPILPEKERLHKLLKRLMDENYIKLSDNAFRFVSPMLADWWCRSYNWER